MNEFHCSEMIAAYVPYDPTLPAGLLQAPYAAYYTTNEGDIGGIRIRTGRILNYDGYAAFAARAIRCPCYFETRKGTFQKAILLLNQRFLDYADFVLCMVSNPNRSGGLWNCEYLQTFLALYPLPTWESDSLSEGPGPVFFDHFHYLDPNDPREPRDPRTSMIIQLHSKNGEGFILPLSEMLTIDDASFGATFFGEHGWEHQRYLRDSYEGVRSFFPSPLKEEFDHWQPLTKEWMSLVLIRSQRDLLGNVAPVDYFAQPGFDPYGQ